MSESMNFEAMRELAFGSVGASYTLVGTPASPAVRMLIVNNYTDQMLNFSLNGTTDHFVLDEGQSLTLDICTNRTQKGFYLGAGKAIYVKHRGVAPTSGAVFFSTVYGEIRSVA
jgi:hypothetical protein